MSDLISRANAIETVRVCDVFLAYQGENIANNIDGFVDSMVEQMRVNISRAVSALPSAEAEPTVIRSKTLLPTKDFKEWAKRIREVNPNAVVIPCDAEVVSAEAAHGWIPCSKRLPENTAEWKAYLTCSEAGLISTTYWADGWNCSRNLDGEINRVCELTDIVAWMPLPEPYRE